jgi:hypothetical protein
MRGHGPREVVESQVIHERLTINKVEGIRAGNFRAEKAPSVRRSIQTERSHTMGDKGGKKDKNKGQKQKETKQAQKDQKKQDKQKKKTP